jgi:hypothetical protein
VASKHTAKARRLRYAIMASRPQGHRIQSTFHDHTDAIRTMPGL